MIIALHGTFCFAEMQSPTSFFEHYPREVKLISSHMKQIDIYPTKV